MKAKSMENGHPPAAEMLPPTPLEIRAEMVLILHSIKAMRDRYNQDIDAMADIVRRLANQIQPRESRPSEFTNFTKKDLRTWIQKQATRGPNRTPRR